MKVETQGPVSMGHTGIFDGVLITQAPKFAILSDNFTATLTVDGLVGILLQELYGREVHEARGGDWLGGLVGWLGYYIFICLYRFGLAAPPGPESTGGIFYDTRTP
jgi:hypothetical protein